MKNPFYLFLFFLHLIGYSQSKGSPIVIEHADFQDINQYEFPDAMILTGNIRANHDGAILSCNKAYYYMKENYLKAFGNVNIVQGDTLYLHGDYAEYNGNIRHAYTTGNVSLRSPEMSLLTDKINFDRNSQVAYYDTAGTIVNNENTLTSNEGKYYVAQKKYQFLKAVTITNPKYVIKSNHLDYYTDSGHSYMYGPSTITSKENYIYTEKGFYNTKTNKANFVKNSYIKYNDRLIKGDSLYYDRNQEFASASRNVKITDSINKAIIKGHYGEVYRKKDSLFITKMASVRYLIEKDSMFVHAKRIVITGKQGERVVRGYNNVRFFKTDMSGKCDSIHSDQKKALTQLIGKPILWNYDNQLTGDLMHLIGNNKTEKLDSLKVLKNAFIASKDTIGTGFNQVKGMNLYGKFLENKLKEVDIVKNTEVVYYMRDDNNALIGIKKGVCSKINLFLNEDQIETITYYKEVDGTIYPEIDLPENARKLRGFNWRGDERIKTKDEIYPQDELELDKKIRAESKIIAEKESIAEEKLKNDVNNNPIDNEIYTPIFKKYNNFIIKDKNGHILLVKSGKFMFPANEKAVSIYKKKYPKFKNEITINQSLWNYKTMQFGKYDGGLFYGNEELSEVEFPAKDFLSLSEIFSLYNNRTIIDKNGQKLYVSKHQFKFPANDKSYELLRKKYPKHKSEVLFNQVIWDWNTMQFGKYDGGLFNGDEIEEETEMPKKNNLTYEEIFSIYNNRIIKDQKGQTLLVKDGKFRFPNNQEAITNYKYKHPEYALEIYINQIIWDYSTMQYGQYDGGMFDGNEP